MLQRRPEQPLDPDQEVTGTCPACGRTVHCRASECRLLPEPGIGHALCVSCPTIKGLIMFPTEKESDGYLRCGRRIRVSPVES